MPSRRGAAMNVGLSISILLFLHSLQDPSFKDHYFFLLYVTNVCVQCVCVYVERVVSRVNNESL